MFSSLASRHVISNNNVGNSMLSWADSREFLGFFFFCINMNVRLVDWYAQRVHFFSILLNKSDFFSP